MNILILQGNLTRDFELKNGVAKTSIAVKNYKGTLFVDLVAFKNVAENCVKFNRKGDAVVVEGELDINKYQDKTYVSCVITRISTIGKKKETEEMPKTIHGEPVEKAEEIASISDDDLPF